MTTTSACVGLGRGFVAGLLQQPGHALRVVDVHLAAVGFDEIFHFFHPCAGLSRTFVDLRVSPFAFRFRLSPQVPEAPAQPPEPHSVGAAPPIIRATSSIRASRFELDHGGLRAALRHRLRDLKMRVPAGRDLRKVRDAEHLIGLADAAEVLPHHVRHPAADAGVDFVEDQRLARRARRRQRSDGQHHARQLAARRDFCQRPQVLADVGREIALRDVDALLGPGGFRGFRFEAHLEFRPTHRELAKQILETAREFDGGLAAFSGEAARALQESFAGRLAFGGEAGLALIGVRERIQLARQRLARADRVRQGRSVLPLQSSMSARRSSTSCSFAGEASMSSPYDLRLVARSSSCDLIASRASRCGLKRRIDVGQLRHPLPDRAQTAESRLVALVECAVRLVAQSLNLLRVAQHAA